jgi:hypothetical protein
MAPCDASFFAHAGHNIQGGWGRKFTAIGVHWERKTSGAEKCFGVNIGGRRLVYAWVIPIVELLFRFSLSCVALLRNRKGVVHNIVVFDHCVQI